MSHDEPIPPSDAETVHFASIGALVLGLFAPMYAFTDSLWGLTLVLGAAAVVIGLVGVVVARHGLRGNRWMSSAAIGLGAVALLILALRWLSL